MTGSLHMGKAYWCANRIAQIINKDNSGSGGYDHYAVTHLRKPDSQWLADVTFYDNHQPSACSRDVPYVAMCECLLLKLPGWETGP